MPLNVTSSPRQLGDGNSQSTTLNPALDAAGNPAKLSFFGATPVVQPSPGGNTSTPAAGSGTQVYVNTTFDGGIGTTAYTAGDVVAALKSYGLLPAMIGYSVVAASSLSAGTIAFDSANGWTTGENPPQLSITLPNDGTVELGDYVCVEHSQNSFSTSLFTPWQQITMANVISSGEGSGFSFTWDTATLPGGSTSFRAYFGRGADSTHITLQSPASNIITDTLNTPQATITLTDGAWNTASPGKSKYIAVASPDYQMVFGSVLGQISYVRGTKAVQNTKSYAEFRMDGWYASSGIYLGFDDGSINLQTLNGNSGYFSSTVAMPGGTGGAAGISFALIKGQTTFFVSKNHTDFVGWGTCPALAVNDRLGFALDNTTPSAPVLTVYHIRGTTVTNVGSITLTSQIPTNFYPFVGGKNGNGTAADGSSDCMTFLPRTTDWASTSSTPPTGFTFEA